MGKSFYAVQSQADAVVIGLIEDAAVSDAFLYSMHCRSISATCGKTSMTPSMAATCPMPAGKQITCGRSFTGLCCSTLVACVVHSRSRLARIDQDNWTHGLSVCPSGKGHKMQKCAKDLTL